MKKKNGYFAFLLIALVTSIQCFANQHPQMSDDKSQTSDHYYITPGGVFVHPNGIFVMVQDNLFIQVNMLCTDEKGVFIPEIEMSRQFVRCPFCQKWYDPENPQGHDCRGP